MPIIEPPIRVLAPTAVGPASIDKGCRLCGTKLHRTLLDLGPQPLANRTLLTPTDTAPAYPLHVRMCDNCKLVQVVDVVTPTAMFMSAPHLTSRSAVRVQQAGQLAVAMCKRLGLDGNSLVIEIGSNDGYLLRHFHAAGIPVLGVDAAPVAAAAAERVGVPTEVAFFNTGTAMEIAVRHGCADLVVAHNVLGHAPDLFDFAAGAASILRPNGVVSLQVPHVLALVQRLQFDALRHDCFSYLSLQVLERVLRSVGLRVFDVERVPDHGGSLRVQACHALGPNTVRAGVKSVRLAETFAELDRRDLYSGFANRVSLASNEIVGWLRVKHAAGRRVVGYGAAVRGAAMLNACGIRQDLVGYVADNDPEKAGRWLPGSQIPVVPFETLLRDKPDDVLVLPWTNAVEIADRLQPLRESGTQLWSLIPRIARL